GIVHARGRPVVDATGAVTEYIGTSTDVTKRRAAEAELRKQAELLSLSHEALLVREPDGRISFWNRGAEETYGWTAEEALGKRAHGLLQTVFPAPFAEIETILREQGRWNGELVQVRRDGARIVVASRWSQQRDERGRPAAALETNTEVTARKRAEEALRESEERYRALIEVSPQMVWMTGADGSNIYFNQWWYDYTGLTRAESEGFGWARAVHPEHRERSEEIWRQAVAAGGGGDGEVPGGRAADGEYRWHLSRGPPIPQPHGGGRLRVGGAVGAHATR